MPAVDILCSLFLLDGYGDWSNDGCNTSMDPNYVICHCDHLTNFAVLLVYYIKTFLITVSDLGCFSK